MGKCPFCSSSIEEDVLLYGGSCPKCFGVIPGEEAATDPGEAVRAEEAASDNRRMAFKALIPVLLAVPLVVGLLGVAVGMMWWNQDPPVAEVMTFEEDFITFEADIVAIDPSLFDEDGNRKPNEKTDPKVKSGPRPQPRANPTGTAPPPEPEVAPKNPTDVVVKRSPGNPFTDGPDVSTSRSGETLSDSGQINRMIKRVMTTRQATLVRCYNKRLKSNEDLQGRWRAFFTVAKNGRPQNVRFEGTTMHDAELESCLSKEVAKWKFSPIAKDQPVEKSWRFRR